VTLVEGIRRFDAPRERVFALLTSPDVIAAAMPAVRGHEVVDDDHWRAKVKPPLPLAPTMTVRFEVLDRREPEHARLHAHGGGADVTSTFDLEQEGAATVMRWRTELHLTGLLDRLAGHGLDAIARRQADRTLDEVTRRL
jgi:carbon monoxide dehydrogenase subunit G